MSTTIVRLLAWSAVALGAPSSLVQVVAAFTNPTHHRCISDVRSPQRTTRHHAPVPRRSGASSTTSFAIPDVSSLPLQYPEPLTTTTSASPPPQAVAASLSAALTYLSLIAYFDRPRGSLSLPDAASTLIIQPSRVPGAGLGLFAAQSLPKGTLLGTYPGVLRPAQAFYDGKCRQFPNAVGYSWRFTDSKYVIDPTDRQGEILGVCFGGSEVPLSYATFATLFRFLGVNTMLCRINEPPIGAGGCNVSARENLAERTVVFELVQDVYRGQELYLDYGLDYDRTRYGPPPGGDQLPR